jgi:hypothetical protein
VRFSAYRQPSTVVQWTRILSMLGSADDAYEGHMSLGPPNNVAAAYACKDQRAAPATTLLPISANEESACAAGTLTTTNNDNDVEQ